MDRDDPVLVGPRVVVRLPLREDADALARFYRENDAHLSVFETPRPRAFLDPFFWTAEVARRRTAYARDHAARLVVVDREGRAVGEPDEVIGVAHLTSIVRGVVHLATLSYAIAERAEGKGLMAEALGLVVGHAFGPMNLHRLVANHRVENRRSARLLDGLGFAIEGYARAYLLANGRWVDHVLRARVNPAWRVPPGTLVRHQDGRVEELRPDPDPPVG